MVYWGHLASVDQSGEGLAFTEKRTVERVGISQNHVARCYQGTYADGGTIIATLSEHVLQYPRFKLIKQSKEVLGSLSKFLR